MQCKNKLSESSSLARARSRTPAPQRTGADDVFLFVKTHYGGSFKVDGVHASDTIDNVKAKIQDRLTNIPMSEMKLVQELEADGACGGVELGWYGIKRFGEVRMVPATSLAPRGEDTMPIFVNTASGKIITLVVLEPVQIDHLKELIDDKLIQILGYEERIPPDQQRLTFLGKPLEDDKTFIHYQICAGCLLEVARIS